MVELVTPFLEAYMQPQTIFREPSDRQRKELAWMFKADGIETGPDGGGGEDDKKVDKPKSLKPPEIEHGDPGDEDDSRTQ